MQEQPPEGTTPSENQKTVLESADKLLGDDSFSYSEELSPLDSLIDVGKSSSPTEVIDGPLSDLDEYPKEFECSIGKTGRTNPPTRATLSIGSRSFSPFNDRYWIGEQIGTGGMGLVHLGWDLNLQRHVAIKLIRKERKGDKQHLHRFLREARIASRLRHPGILGIHDFSVEPSGMGYIVMDLITGKTLEQAFKESKDQESKRQSLLTTFLQICQAMSFAHANGVVHRDLKPANIMVGGYGLATVLDWGLAKVLGAEKSTCDELSQEFDSLLLQSCMLERNSQSPESFNTLFGTVMGTPYYLAPEQARGEPVDYRADVFSLGGILCHLLTGSPPFDGKKIVDVYQQSVAGDVSRAMNQLDRCGAPIPIVKLAKRCLSPDVASRPENAGFLAHGLEEYFESGQRRAEEELVRFFDLSLDLFCIANTEGYFWKLNGNFTKALGYTNSELTSKPFIEFVHPDDRPDTLKEITRLSRGEPTIQFKNRYRKKNGQYLWLEWTARSLAQEGVIYAVARDITERIRLEEEKNRIESDRFRLSEIVESASDAIIAKDLQGVVQSWNSGAENLLGYSAEEMIGRRICEIIPPDRLGEEAMILDRICNGERVEHFETVRLHKSGERIEISLSVSPIRDPMGAVIGASKIAKSLSKQRMLEVELTKIRDALIEFADSTDIPLHFVDATGTILWANHAELNFLGYTLDEYIGQPIAKFHADKQAISDIFNQRLEGKSLTHHRAKLIAKDGTIKDVAVYSSVSQENGQLLHTRCFTIDLSLLKDAKQS